VDGETVDVVWVFERLFFAIGDAGIILRGVLRGLRRGSDTWCVVNGNNGERLTETWTEHATENARWEALDRDARRRRENGERRGRKERSGCKRRKNEEVRWQVSVARKHQKPDGEN
jgi:hypothetical protein